MLFKKETEDLCRQACTEMGEGYDYDKIISAYDLFPGKHAKSAIAYLLQCILIEWDNKLTDPSWIPNYLTKNRKWFRVFWGVEAYAERPSGFGLSAAYSHCNDSLAIVASRLYFCSEERERAMREPMQELDEAYRLM